ncbi:MAG: DNA starvation/stationary phase protection protein [Betaproteobacteria bacterium]
MNKSVAAVKESPTREGNPPVPFAIDRKAPAAKDIAGAMKAFLADAIALFLKTKNFHWHMKRPHLSRYQELLSEHAGQIFAMADPIAERIHHLGESPLVSIGYIARTQRVQDNDAEYVEPLDMLTELHEDNRMLAARFREVHNVCYQHHDVATANLLNVWIDEAERRSRTLLEATRPG